MSITKGDVHVYSPKKVSAAVEDTKLYRSDVLPMKKVDPNTGQPVTVETRIFNDGPCFTQQSAKDECDINLIVESAKRGADISHLSSKTPMYGDFTGLPDYREALLMVNRARDSFMSLDARVRERFGNDPAKMLDFLNDPSNREEAVKLGLLKAPEVPKVDEHLETLKSIDKGLKARSDEKSKKPKGDGD